MRVPFRRAPGLRVLSGWLVAAAAATLAVEIVVRIFVQSPIPTQTDPHLGRLMQPNTFYRQSDEGSSAFVTNRFGFNDVEPPADLNDAIVILGDSYVEAQQVQRDVNFAAILRAHHPHQTIVSAGRAGLSPVSYKDLLDYVMHSAKPRAIVVVLNSSDIKDIRDSQIKILRSSDGRISSIASRENRRPQGVEADAYRYLVGQSSIFARLNYKYVDMFKQKARWMRAALQGHREPADNDSEDAPLANKSPKEFKAATLGKPDLIDLASVLLRELQARALVRIVYIPSLTYSEGGITAQTDSSSEAEGIFGCAAARTHTAFLSLADSLTTQFVTTGIPPNGFANMAFGEGHLNSEGHRILADAISRLVFDSVATPIRGAC